MFNTFPSTGHITTYYGNRGVHPVTNKPNAMHYGVDFAYSTAKNKNIISVGAGVCRVSEKQAGYGEVILIQHIIGGRIYETLYAHLEKRYIKKGDKVSVGQLIGLMGNTGRSGGTHLHFELFNGKFKSDFSNTLNPLLYMRDDSVGYLQELLNKNGANLDVDRYFGNGTINAIGTFQAKSGLVADGFCGKVTLNKLKEITLQDSNKIASDEANTHTNNKEDDTMRFSSPALQSEVENILANKSTVTEIVKFAIANGANEKVWMDKLEKREYTEHDIIGLAAKAIIDKYNAEKEKE